MPLRNSLHRRNHRERGQLAHRTKLGLLEKHRDYVKRARDYHSKHDRLTRLKQKAAEKNKDEFYFSMNSERTKGGVHIRDRGNAALPTDYVKLLKTQDENYVRTIRMSNVKKIDSIKRQLTEMADLFISAEDEGLDADEYKVLRDAGVLSQCRKRKTAHVLFASSVEEAQTLGAPRDMMEIYAPKQVSDSQEDLGWKQVISKKKSKPRPAKVDSEEEWEDDIQPSAPERRRQLLKELSSRLHRDLQLRYAQREFEMQRLLMGKGAKQKIAGTAKVERDNVSEEDQDELDARKGRRTERPTPVDEATYKPRVYKWKLERKR